MLKLNLHNNPATDGTVIAPFADKEPDDQKQRAESPNHRVSNRWVWRSNITLLDSKFSAHLGHFLRGQFYLYHSFSS